MSQFSNDLSDKYQQLSPREKWLIYLGSLVLLLWLGLFYWLWPLQQEVDDKQALLQQQYVQIDSIAEQLDVYQRALTVDPDQQTRRSLQQTKQAIEQQDLLLKQQMVAFVAPEQMRQVLQQLLQREPQVKVVALNTEPSTQITVEGLPENTVVPIYRHRIKLTITGSYFALQRYLARIESLNWQFEISNFLYQVKEYPTAELQLELTTISADEQFISL